MFVLLNNPARLTESRQDSPREKGFKKNICTLQEYRTHEDLYGSHMKYSLIPKGGDVGFPNNVNPPRSFQTLSPSSHNGPFYL